MHNKGAVLGRGRSRGGQSVATYVKGVATYAKGGGSTSRGRTRRGSVGSAGGALPNRTHLQCFGRYPVTSSSRSRPVLPRGKPQAESTGGSPPRPRGLGQGHPTRTQGPPWLSLLAINRHLQMVLVPTSWKISEFCPLYEPLGQQVDRSGSKNEFVEMLANKCKMLRNSP